MLCDAGYSSRHLRRVIHRQWRAKPLIKAASNHEEWIAEETPEWKRIFSRRVAVERAFGRMKNHRRLNNVTVRTKGKVTVHSLLPVIVTQATALAFPDQPRCCAL